MLREILSDEQGNLSSPRVGSMLCTIAGILSIVVGFVMVWVGIKDTTTYVAMVLAATMTKGASDLWAAQVKSAKVLSATTTTATAPPVASPAPAKVDTATPKTTTATDASTKAGGAP